MAQITGLFRIGRDAEVRFTASNEAVASLSLAFDYGQKGQDGKRPSQWIEASLWGKRAESLAQYLVKGWRIYATINDPHIETFEKRDGSGQGVKLTGKIGEIELAGGKSEGGERQQSSAPAPQRNAQPKPAQDFDDDDGIPF